MAEDHDCRYCESSWVAAVLFIFRGVLVVAEPKIKMLASGDACPDCGLAGLSIDHPITDPSFHVQL